MGMYDDIYCEADLPGDHPDSDRAFQTKSLYRAMLRFTITREGRLIHHSCRYVRDKNPPDGLFRMLPTDREDIDMEFHGDIRLSGFHEGRRSEYVARFTHGTLEWLRPIEQLSEDAQSLVLVRSTEGE